MTDDKKSKVHPPTYRQRIYGYYNTSRQGKSRLDILSELTPRAPYLRYLIRNYFPAQKSASILDLGCGYGSLIHFASQAGYMNVSGVDVSPEQVAAARQLGLSNVKEGDLMNVLESQPDGTLDLIIAFDLIEHLTKDELIALIDHALRALRKDGRFLIHTPNGESPFAGRIRYGDFTHELAFTSASMHQLLISSGFSTVQSFEDQPIVHGVKSGVRFLAWKLIRFFFAAILAVETGQTSSSHIFSQNFLTLAIK